MTHFAIFKLRKVSYKRDSNNITIYCICTIITYRITHITPLNAQTTN
jgi:hypothetical protein